jgi:hypothetical protein
MKAGSNPKAATSVICHRLVSQHAQQVIMLHM